MKAIKNRLMTTLVIFAFTVKAMGQTSSPYHTSWKTNGPVIAAGIGMSYLGLHLIGEKDGLTFQQLEGLQKSDVWFVDRFTAGNYSSSADKSSYYPFYGSFAMPVALLITRNERKHTGQILALYLETMAITGTVYSLTAGTVSRNRPYTYGTDAPLDDRTKKGATRSFFAGHTAATASATFFAAKVFADFHPDSRAKPYVWTAAALVPATVGYLRLKGGMHFLSDNLLGYGIGAGIGILVPQLHKVPNSRWSLVPMVTPDYQSAALSYRL